MPSEQDIKIRAGYKDYIHIYRWLTIAEEFIPQPDIILPSAKIIYVAIESISKFFHLCKTQKPLQKYVVISGPSDFGIVEQKLNPVNADLRKRLDFVDFKEFTAAPEYCKISIGPCCDGQWCNINDRYSLKCYAHTCSTFDEIPDCIHHWFCCNAMVDHPKITCIPFGLGSNEDAQIIDHMNKQDPQKLLYLNFTNYNNERSYLKDYYKKLPWSTVQEKWLSKEDYYRELLDHFFVMCPFGNGVDCYRTLETLYLGRIPIVTDCNWSQHLKNIFPFMVYNLFNLQPNVLAGNINLYKSFSFINNPYLKFSTWENMIHQKLQEIS